MNLPLSREQRIAGLLHPDFFVRDSMLELFSEAHDPDPAVSAAATRAIDEHGWDGAFRYPSTVSKLKCDENVAAWIVDELVRDEPKADLDHTRSWVLMSWLSDGPVEFLEARFDAFLESLSPRGKSAMRSNESLAASIEHVRQRLEWNRTPHADRISLLEEQIQKATAIDDFPGEELSTALDIFESLQEETNLLSHKALEWLDFDENAEFGEAHWRGGLGIQIAGRLGLDSATDRLIDLYAHDWDWWNEIIAESLILMRSAVAHNRVVERFPGLEWHARLFLTGTLENLRLEGREDNVAKLLQGEEDQMIQTNLALALAKYGTERSLAIAREFFLKDPSDPERFEIARMMHAIRRLADDDDPELDLWRKEMQQKEERQAQAQQRLASLTGLMPGVTGIKADTGIKAARKPIGRPVQPRSEKKTGRNEPCPCGSGKKFKKCCLGKDDDS